MAQRAIMTWSFDGLLPRRFARSASPTRHTPAVAILATALVSIPLAVWICYSDNFFQYFAIAAVSAYPSLVLVGITATLIKRRRPISTRAPAPSGGSAASRCCRSSASSAPSSAPRRSPAVLLPHRGRPGVHEGDRDLPGRDVRARRGLVDGRAAMRRGQGVDLASSTRRSHPNEAVPRRKAASRLRRGSASSPTFTARSAASEVPEHGEASTTSSTSSSGVTSPARPWSPSSAVTEAGMRAFNDHEYGDMSERERSERGAADPRRRPVSDHGEHDELVELFSPSSARPDVPERRRRRDPALDGDRRRAARGHGRPVLRDAGQRRLLGIDEPLKAAERCDSWRARACGSTSTTR